MKFFKKKQKNKKTVAGNSLTNKEKVKFYKKKWFIVTSFVFGLLILFLGGFLYKTGHVWNKISIEDDSIFGSLLGGVLPASGDETKDEDGRINILLMGVRGSNMPGGGMLADTIMLVSLKPDEGKMALISIPRDLYVKSPETGGHTKINAIYVYGQENGKNKGIENMKQVVGEITGLNVQYAAILNFTGFKQLIDAVGGVEIELETAFYEVSQFVVGNECGREFILPKGSNLLDGEKALCYVRARYNTSDFDRAKRQQIVLKKLKEKLTSLGTLTDFSKLNKILDAIGDNVRTDITSSQMRNLYEEYSSIEIVDTRQRVLENSEEGFLVSPTDYPQEVGYILIPRAGIDNYSAIQDVVKNIFILPPQSDIDPVKQYYRPQPVQVDKEDDEKKSSKKKDKDDDEDEDDEDKDDDK